MSLKKIALGAAAMSAVNILKLLAQFVTVPILARLLSPADYGLVAIAMPFILFVMLIADSGLGMSLVRTSRDNRAEWSTCFWLAILMGGVLSLLMGLLGPIIAYFYAEPKLTPIVWSLSLIIVGQTIALIPNAALQQQKKFGVISIIDLASIAASISTAVYTAMHGAGVWALVGQQLALYAVRIALTLWLSPFKPQFLFDLKLVHEHLRFGRDVLSVNLVGFFTRSMDNMVLGKVLGAAPVGIYSMAFQFLRLPFMLVTGPLMYVLYAQLSPVRDDKEHVKANFLVLTRLLAIIIFPAMAMVAAAQQPIFHLLLSPKWAESGQIFALAAAATAVQAVTALNATLMMVLGRTALQLRVATEYFIIWAAGLLVSVWFGLTAVALAYVLIVLLYVPRSLSLTLPVIGCSYMQYFGTMLLPAGFALLLAFLYHAMILPIEMNEVLQIAVAVGFGLIALLLSVGLQYRSLMADIRHLHKR